MENKRLTHATIVASPTATSWSQAYIAGTIFVVVSLNSEATSEEEISLGAIGKEILNTLEAEYFTLETKNLSSIKQAFEVALKPALQKKTLVVSAGLFSIIDNVLYIMLLGGAKTVMKRNDTLGTLLTSDDTTTISSASGMLEDNDIVILETKKFSSMVSKDHLKNSLHYTTPSEIAENLSPSLHEKEEGGATAVILLYKTPAIETPVQEETYEKESFTTITKEKKLVKIKGFASSFLLHLFQFVKKRMHLNFNRKQKMFLSLAILLVFLLFGSGIFVLTSRETARNEAKFQEVFSLAKAKYDEGQNLLPLNKNLARDDFQEAKKILLEKGDTFPKNSKYETKLSDLLKTVESSLALASGVNTIQASPTTANSTLLETAKKYNAVVTQDEKNVYGIDQDAIFTVDKKSESKKAIIPNNDHWTNIGGIGVYTGNVYVLDKKLGQIFKFTNPTFAKSNYFSGSGQDFSTASSLAIDGSIWVLFENGEIKKFTRGKLDELKISDLDKGFSKPSRIFTDAETANVYILDRGNSRVVVLNKSGVYQTQYQADILKNAKEFEVLEKDKKILVLRDEKLWVLEFPSN